MSCLLAVCLALGVTANSYDELDPSYAYNLKVGDEVYAWLGYEDQHSKILGQNLTELNMLSIGVGAKYEMDNNWFAFMEAGYAFTDTEDSDFIRNEIVFTTLVNHHAVEGHRPLPAGDPLGRWTGAKTLYELGDGFLGRLGVGYQYEMVSVSLAYRFLVVKEHMEWWDPERRDRGLGWWQETNSRDLSAFELGISYAF